MFDPLVCRSSSAAVGLLAALAVASLVGCGGMKPAAPDVKKLLDEVHDKLKPYSTLEAVEVTKSETTGDPPETIVHFTATEKLKKDFFVPATVDEAYDHYQFDATALRRAATRMLKLREPERDAVAKKLPNAPNAEKVYRRVKAAGDSFHWYGQATAKLVNGDWRLYKYEGEVVGHEFDTTSVPRDSLPGDAIVLGEPGDNELTKWIAAAEPFVAAVDAAEKAVAERLDREAKTLDAATQAGKSYSASWPRNEGAPSRLRVTFVAAASADPAASESPEAIPKVAARFADASGGLDRGVWIGERSLPPLDEAAAEPTAPRPNPDGWSLELRPAGEGEPYPPNANGSIRLTPTADGGLAWSAGTLSGVLTAEASGESAPPASTSLSDAAKAVEAATSPGRVWEGKVLQSGRKAEPVRLTFTERRDGGRFVRASLEFLEPALARAVAPLEGSAASDVASVHGWPIRLVCRKGLVEDYYRWRQIAEAPVEESITLAFDESGRALVGRDRRGGEYRLEPTETIPGLASRLDQWKAALTAGKTWAGGLTLEGQSPRDARLIVAEARDSWHYVRVLIEDAGDPHLFVVYEGSLDPRETMLETYALSLNRVVGSPGAGRVNVGADQILGRPPENAIQLRLSPDGRRLIGPAHARETMTLVATDSPAAVPLDRESFSRLWREKLTKGSRWRGTLVNPGADQKADVELAITADVGVDGQVTATLGVLKQPKSRLEYTGSLRVNDATVNAFALQLVKQGMGEGASAAFGASPAELHFRLTPDGTRLVGMAGQGDWREFLDLKRQEAAVPKNEASAPKSDEAGAKLD